jgi:hypothetical protein
VKFDLLLSLSYNLCENFSYCNSLTNIATVANYPREFQKGTFSIETSDVQMLQVLWYTLGPTVALLALCTASVSEIDLPFECLVLFSSKYVIEISWVTF